MKPTFIDLLEEDERRLWQQYEIQLERGQRKTSASGTLQSLITGLKSYRPEQTKVWIEAFCREVFDEQTRDRIPQPLFVELILPELKRGFDKAELPYARWIAQAAPYIYRATKQKPEISGLIDFNKITPCDFYEVAIQHDPSDNIAQQALITDLSRNFDYYIHEVPTGLLCKPDVFQVELAKFAALIKLTGLLEKYEKKFVLWQFHCQAWANYLAYKQEFANYAEYLGKNSNGFDWKNGMTQNGLTL